jgi:hypothetical protein
MRSWQERVPGPIELREKPTTIALCTHHQGSSSQFIDLHFAVCDLAQLDAMLSNRILELRETKLDFENFW